MNDHNCSIIVTIQFGWNRLFFSGVVLDSYIQDMLDTCCSCICVLTLVLQVPTAREMIDMWKKNHNAFGILYSWFLAKVCYFYPRVLFDPIIMALILKIVSIFFCIVIQCQFSARLQVSLRCFLVLSFV